MTRRQSTKNTRSSGNGIETYSKTDDINRFVPNPGQIFENLDEWLTHDEAAKYLRLSSGALRNMVCSGVVSCYKLGRRNRYSKAELRSLLKRKGDLVWA